MNFWIVASIIFAWLLIGLAVDSWAFGADAPIKRKNIAIWLLWPVTLVTLVVGIFRTRRKKR